MAENISKEDALKIALRHLVAEAQKKIVGVQNFEPLLYDRVPDGLPLYMRSEEDREHCWCVFVQSDGPCIGRGRYICISKETGEVIFDGWAGE